RIFAGRVIANFLVAESASTKLGSIRVGRAARGGQALWLFTPAFYERLDNLFVHGLADLIDAEACWPLARRVLDKRLEEFSRLRLAQGNYIGVFDPPLVIAASGNLCVFVGVHPQVEH